MTNTIATTVNTLDTIATGTEKTFRIAATIAWIGFALGVMATGLCINATADAREAYAQETIDLYWNEVELESEPKVIHLLPPAKVIPLVAPMSLDEAWAKQFSLPAIVEAVEDEQSIIAEALDLLSYRELQKMAKDLDLKANGKKAVLKERILGV